MKVAKSDMIFLGVVFGRIVFEKRFPEPSTYVTSRTSSLEVR